MILDFAILSLVDIISIYICIFCVLGGGGEGDNKCPYVLILLIQLVISLRFFPYLLRFSLCTFCCIQFLQIRSIHNSWLLITCNSKFYSYAATWTDKNKDRSVSTTNQVPSSRDFLGDFLVWKPPVGLEKSQTFWIALTLWIGLVGAALFIQK